MCIMIITISQLIIISWHKVVYCIDVTTNMLEHIPFFPQDIEPYWILNFTKKEDSNSKYEVTVV